MGQTEPVTVFRYQCVDTIEERIDRLLEEKRTLFSEVVDGVSLSLEDRLTQAELFGLLDLNPPT